MARLRAWLPFLSAAVLGALAMDYPQVLSVLIFVFLTPLIAVAGSIDLHDRRAIAGAFFKMFVFGFVFAVLSTPWVASTYPLTWLNIPEPVLGALIVALIWIALGVALSLPITPWIFVLAYTSRMRPVAQAIVGASSWILLEYLRSWFVAVSAYGDAVLSGPHHTYYSLAYVLSVVPVVRDMFPVGGMPLVTFVVVVVNFIVYRSYQSYRARTRPPTDVIWLAIGVCAVVISSSLLMSHIRGADTPHEAFTVSVLNTHLPSSTDDDVAEQKALLALELIRTIPKTDGIVILPENIDILNTYLEPGGDKNNPLSNFHLVVASQPDDHAHTMYFFEPATRQGVKYTKQLLMPIGEYSVSWVEFLVHATRMKSWIDVYDYRVIQNGAHKGTAISLYHDPVIEGAVFAGSICAENISPYIFREETRAGATVLTNLSALSPFRNSPTLQRQTQAIDTARALENGRYLIVAGNDNASLVIADTGDIVRRNDPQLQNSVFDASVYVRTYTTPYVAYGDYMVALALGVLLIAVVWFAI